MVLWNTVIVSVASSFVLGCELAINTQFRIPLIEMGGRTVAVMWWSYDLGFGL